MSNKRGKSSNVVWVFGILLVAILVVLGIFGFSYLKNQDFNGVTTNSGVTVPNSLVGKSATVSVRAIDKATDNSNTRANVPLYVKSPSGVYLETGGVSTASTGADTQITNGISVQTSPYSLTAFNNTYQSVNGPQQFTVNSESPATVVTDVYKVAPSLSLTMFDENDNVLTTANMSLSPSQTKEFSKLRVENDNSNTAYNLAGIYANLAEGTNVSSISINDNNVGAEGSMPLRRTTNDDMTWKLNKPVMLYEFDEADISNIAVTANGNGCNGEAWTFYVADEAYYFSSQGKGVQYGFETDGTNAKDVGAPDQSISGYCN